MHLSLIAAVAQNNVIGNNNQLPWHLPADLIHFKQLTLNKPVIMGRKTFESIGRPLPNRRNIVITRNAQYAVADVECFSSLEQALQVLENYPEVMIIGGVNLFGQGLTIADRLYLTIIHHDFVGDTYFPEIDFTIWQEISREDHSADEQNKYNYSFVKLERKRT